MSKKIKAIVQGGVLTTVSAMALPVLAAESAKSFNSTEAMTTAMNSASNEIMDMIAVALPIGLGLVATFLAIKKGIGFFKSLVNKAS